MKTENKNSLKVVQAIQAMDEIDIFRLIAKKRRLQDVVSQSSELSHCICSLAIRARSKSLLSLNRQKWVLAKNAN